ncbi:MAG: T9SS type A sorting domain-containing protein [Bacteroidia bacterium]
MKNYILLLSLTIFASRGFSQAVKWQNLIGGDNNDVLYSVQQTSDGGYILGGTSNSGMTGDKTEDSYGDKDFWLLKTDRNGGIIWQNTIVGCNPDELKIVEETADHGYILGGYSFSNNCLDKTEDSQGGTDFWVIKTDSLGNILWQNTIGGSYLDELSSLVQMPDGGFLFGGSSGSPVSGDKTEPTQGLNDYWIVRTDSLGAILWQNTIGGSENDYLSSIKLTPDGGFLLGGSSGSGISGDKTEPSLFGNAYDYWIVKTDSLGNIQWQNTIGGNDYDFLKAIDLTSDGGFILGGYSPSLGLGDKTETGPGGFDYWIVKTDALGNIQWQKTIGGSLNDFLYDVHQTDDGGYILGGYSISRISGDKTEQGNFTYLNDDFWVIKTDSVGNIVWQNVIGGDGYEKLYKLQQVDDRSFILGGVSNSVLSGDVKEPNMGFENFWIVNVTESYNLITGKLFADINFNGVQDSGEIGIGSRKIVEQNTGDFCFSNADGSYLLAVFDSGTYQMASGQLMWYNYSPAFHQATFSGMNLKDSLNDFAFQPAGSFVDVCLTITPMGPFRSGRDAYYEINYGNYGTTAVTPVVYFFPDNQVTFQSASLNPNQVTPDSVVWNLPQLAPFEKGKIVVRVSVLPGLPIGTMVNSSAHIEPYLTDDNPSCNNSNWEVYTVGACDPNDILVNKDTLMDNQLNPSPWLDYIIRFQNTGNDTAFYVKVLNPIDTNKLNIGSFELVNTSHPVELKWVNYQLNMEFEFNNILLPDSNVNELESHGFIHYRIQPASNLIAGDSIVNFAAIYFDFNDPVLTNTARTDIVLATGLAMNNRPDAKLLLFPNPAGNKVMVAGFPLVDGIAEIRLINVLGEVVNRKISASPTAELELTNLAPGLYIVQAGELRSPLIKQ